MPRISVESGASPSFVDSTGEAYKPAGQNYSRILPLSFPGPDGGPINDHATFHTGIYDAGMTNSVLTNLKNSGYNFVRVFINGKQHTYDGAPVFGVSGPVVIGRDHWNGLYVPYMNNVLDMLAKANALGLYVELTFEWLPSNDYYDAGAPPTDVDGINRTWMSTGYIEQKKNYLTNFMQFIKNADPDLLTTIVSVDLQNELFMDVSIKPFTLTSTVSLPCGQSFDMSQDAARQDAVDKSFNYWCNEMTAAVHSVDPSILCTASVFTFAAINMTGPNGVHHNPGEDQRYPARPVALLQSDLSYIDIHLYPGFRDVDIDLTSIEWSSLNQALKPLWLGEFGAFTQAYPDLTAAAYAMKAFKNEMITRGFDAWSFWLWNSENWNPSQGGVWPADYDSGAINGLLAPVVNGWGPDGNSSPAP